MADKDESEYNDPAPGAPMEGEGGLKLQYELAEGPEGLWNELMKLLERSEVDPSFVAKDHYIMYVLGGQRSLIKVEMTKKPFEFWYCDAQGRPPTKAVRETIAEFLWEKGGEKERLGSEAAR